MSVGAAPLVADLRHFLLPGFFAFGVVFVISFRLLNNVLTLLIRPVFAGGAGCLLVLNNVDFLFRWLVAGARSACTSALMRHSPLRMSRRET